MRTARDHLESVAQVAALLGRIPDAELNQHIEALRELDSIAELTHFGIVNGAENCPSDRRAPAATL